MAEDQQTAPAPAPISVPAPTPARGFRLGVKGALLIVLAAFALGVGLVGWMAWDRGIDLRPLLGMKPSARSGEAATPSDASHGLTLADPRMAEVDVDGEERLIVHRQLSRNRLARLNAV